MLIDSHCHLGMLDLTADDNDIEKPLQRARDAGVQHMVTIGVDIPSSKQCIEFAKRYSQVSATVGIHPSDSADADSDEQELLGLAKSAHVVAIGETGLDYYYNKDGYDVMQEWFRAHVRVAKEVKKPLIIHSRDARADTIAILRDGGADEVGGVMHCFTESVEMADQAMELGFYISFSGIVTFKNAKNVQEVAKHVPLERMLVETDSPYLAPVPRRGKQNEPAYVRYVAEYLADLKGVTYEDLVAVTGTNCRQLFRLEMV